MIRDWINRKDGECWQSLYGQRQRSGFLKKRCTKESWRIAEPEQTAASILTGLLTAHCHLQGCLLQLGPVNSPEHVAVGAGKQS